MALLKMQKNKAYYKRLQTKYRRRRSGHTDYFARRKMVTQDKNKYNTPKYRLVVRITNRKIITQVVYSTIMGDRVLTQATSKELEKFDVPMGHSNYAACYATGLLVARRALTIVGLADSIKGVEEADAEDYHVEEEGEGDRRPFKVILDVGLIRTIPGSRVFGVLKGAVDGGLHIPHNIKKFPGATEPEERTMEWEYDASAHLERILGTHVMEYMEMLSEEDPERYKVQFSAFIENDISADDLEEMYKECHSKIRANPVFEKAENKGITHKREGNNIVPSEGVHYCRAVKKSKAERFSRVKQKIAAAQAKMMAAAEEEE